MEIHIQLDEKQLAALEPLFKMAGDAAQDGKPGMIVAQVFPDGARAGFLRHEKAKAFVRSMNTRVSSLKDTDPE